MPHENLLCRRAAGVISAAQLGSAATGCKPARGTAARCLFVAGRERDRIAMMKSIGSPGVKTMAAVSGGLALLAAATGAAFGAWLQHGAAIFLSMAEAGLAWCF
jgi:hypothetical protein